MSFMDKIKNKKGIVIAAIVLIAVAIGGGATLAYFSGTTNEVHNEFKGAAVNISVIENDAPLESTSQDGKELEDTTGNGNINTFKTIIPNQNAPKVVRIKNKEPDTKPTSFTHILSY